MEGDRAIDASGHGADASYEGGVAPYLDGPPIASRGATNHCAHFAGGYLKAPATRLVGSYTVELWFWNGLPSEARGVAGDLVVPGRSGVRLSLTDRLVLRDGSAAKPVAVGVKPVALRTWHHVALVVDGNTVSATLDGGPTADLSARRDAFDTLPTGPLFIGGDPARAATWEGKLDEVAVFDRALGPDEIAAHARVVRPSP